MATVENQDCIFNVHAIVSQYSKNKEKWHCKRQLGAHSFKDNNLKEQLELLQVCVP